MLENKQIVIKNDTDLKLFLHKNYLHQIQNFFGDEKQAMKFLSSVMADVQKNPTLLTCEPVTLVNSYMTMAQLGLMPSGISGESYVLPYGGKAQFQLGYQGLITLFYRAGGTGIRSEIVRKNDKFSYVNGVINHEIDIFQSNKERGEAIGAYAIATVNGAEISKVMNETDIINYGVKFSKSYDAKGKYSPWNPVNDPELWMWKKTVLKQLAKLLPKNETINIALAEDNKDSRMSDVVKLRDSSNLKMSNLLKDEKTNKDKKQIDEDADSDQSSQDNEPEIR